MNDYFDFLYTKQILLQVFTRCYEESDHVRYSFYINDATHIQILQAFKFEEYFYKEIEPSKTIIMVHNILQRLFIVLYPEIV